jgi:CelD/BcsL family acetyltransferase involved in cellulose biosynthesis
MAQQLGCEVFCDVEDVSLELDLPPTWEQYLRGLSQKQRHEIKRKLRRLEEAGNITYQIFEDSDLVQNSIPVFIELLRKSRKEKAMFMTPQMESFFRSLAKAMAQAGLLKLGILELNASPVAALIYFDYNNTVYLYNSGYDPNYKGLSVGVVSKVLCIKDSIERGRGRFDFLKGAEEYKHRLGGEGINLYRCEIMIQ